jgi:hypothetical protein
MQRAVREHNMAQVKLAAGSLAVHHQTVYEAPPSCLQSNYSKCSTKLVNSRGTEVEGRVEVANASHATKRQQQPLSFCEENAGMQGCRPR